MTGFEPQTSGIGNNYSAYWATTTAETRDLAPGCGFKINTDFYETRAFISKILNHLQGWNEI